MKTAVQSTSIEAYHANKADGSLNRQQAELMKVIKHGYDYSLQELSRITGMPINAVSGRIHELKAMGLLEHPEHKRPCQVTKRTINPVRLPLLQFELLI